MSMRRKKRVSAVCVATMFRLPALGFLLQEAYYDASRCSIVRRVSAMLEWLAP